MHKNHPKQTTGCFKTRALWEEAVSEMLDRGITQEIIAHKVGSSQGNISYFVRNRSNNKPIKKLMTEAQMQQALRMRKTMSVKDVAKHFGVSEGYITTRQSHERDKNIDQKIKLIKTQQEILSTKW